MKSLSSRSNSALGFLFSCKNILSVEIMIDFHFIPLYTIEIIEEGIF